MADNDDAEGMEDQDVAGIASFDPDLFEPHELQYGLTRLMDFRQAMLPISKPAAVVGLKFLICPGSGYDGGEAEHEPDRDRLRGGDRSRKGKGKEKGSGKGGRFIPEMGKTDIMPGSQRGNWWRNLGADGLDVIVREQFLLTSDELWKVPPGHYVLQAGPLEVFVSGPASGLQRMPVQPRGWVTVDASSVGGPCYLEKVRSPRWKVVFSSGSSKGDIVVRASVSLDSEEVAVLTCGTMVEQNGPLESTEDGIIRMPIMFAEGVGREPSSASQPPRTRSGWVTCDASAQGGPKFFEPVAPPESIVHRTAPPPPPPAAARPNGDGDAGGEDEPGEGPGAPVQNSWESNRVWKCVSLEETSGDKQLVMVTRAEPYAPGTGRLPPEDIIVRWLVTGDMVEQTGHSKKSRGYMVMPVRLLQAADGSKTFDKVYEGWVTRRVVDKSRESPAGSWFVEILDGKVRSERAKKSGRRRDQKDQHLEEE
ncbi:unnamed protein product [Polarella glacialis]|uniref:Uncharacterized protein n=1 Tax=Polarella glacialis TaxID=89957 RepID=A0A813K9U1_POLGL|nr:unnamed protein product [Polarella glacialis]